jgi:hypothetical protein
VASDDAKTVTGGQFISLWSLFTRIGKAEKALEYEAAGYLMACLDSDPIGMNYLRRREASGLVRPMEMGARLHLVRLLGIFASQGTLLDAEDRPNDDAQPTFERAGFYQSDIFPFLARHDVAIWTDDDAESSSVGDGRRIPGWMKTYADRTWISRSRAAKLLLAQTDKADLPSPHYEDVLDQWHGALSDAIDRGEITTDGKRCNPLLAHADLCAWAQRQCYAWPFAAPNPADAEAVNAVAPCPANSGRALKHTLGTRNTPLNAVIDRAKTLALDGNDSHSVWAALVKLAQDVNRPPPLLGYADEEGIKWDKNGTVSFFTKKAFDGRWTRAKLR